VAQHVSPDHPAKPDSPPDLHGGSWRFALRRAFAEFSQDQCTDLAAALTYYAVLSLFPAALALVAVLGLFGQDRSTIDSVLQVLGDVGASSAVATVRPALEHLMSSQMSGLALVVGVLGALWSASGYIGAFGRAMNRVYEVGEGRPFWKLRPMQIAVTVIALLLVGVIAVGLVVSGSLASAIGRAIGLGDTAVTVFQIAKWPVIVAVVVVVIALLYSATPNVRQPKFRWMSVGALTALVVWVVASAAFGLYVASFGHYDKTYGSFGGVIVFLLWLWITNLALLFGAELDSELERSRELQAGMAAEDKLLLPPKDERQLRKRDKKEARARERAVDLREQENRSTVDR
jgi:membrane protein